MNDLAQFQIDALQEREGIVGSMIKWAGKEYPCSGGDEGGGRMLDLGGFRQKAQITAVVRCAVLGKNNGAMVLPREGDKVQFKPDQDSPYRNCKIAPDGVTTIWNEIAVIILNHEIQGA